MRGDEGTTTCSEGFGDALAELEADGCSLLVVGTVPEEATTAACRRMLGDATAASRDRLLVFTDAACDAATDRLPREHGRGSSHATVVDYATTARNAAADRPTAAGPGDADVDVRRVGTDDIADLGTTVSRAIDDLVEPDSGDGALRVCFDSLPPLLEAHGRETVFQFLHVLTSRIRRANGLAHFHLPVNADAHETRLLAPLFDGVVELRMVDGRPEQRWRLRDADVQTGWLAV